MDTKNLTGKGDHGAAADEDVRAVRGALGRTAESFAANLDGALKAGVDPKELHGLADGVLKGIAEATGGEAYDPKYKSLLDKQAELNGRIAELMDEKSRQRPIGTFEKVVALLAYALGKLFNLVQGATDRGRQERAGQRHGGRLFAGGEAGASGASHGGSFFGGAASQDAGQDPGPSMSM